MNKVITRTLLAISIIIVFGTNVWLMHKQSEIDENKRIIDSIYSADSLAYEYRRDSLNRLFDSIRPIAERRIKELLWKERQLDSINKLKIK